MAGAGTRLGGWSVVAVLGLVLIAGGVFAGRNGVDWRSLALVGAGMLLTAAFFALGPLGRSARAWVRADVWRLALAVLAAVSLAAMLVSGTVHEAGVRVPRWIIQASVTSFEVSAVVLGVVWLVGRLRRS